MATTGVKNVKLGVCSAKFGGADLGLTKGGVTVTIATETHPVSVDQYGSTPINEYITGRSVKVKIPLAETSLENLAKILPGATVTRDAAGNAVRVNVPTGVGLNLLDFASELTLHPIAVPFADTSEDFIVPLAATNGSFDWSYKVDDERVFDIEFTGYAGNNGLLFIAGNKAAVSTEPEL